MRLDISESGRPSAQAGPSQAGRANLAENQGTLQATASLRIEDLAYESQHAEVQLAIAAFASVLSAYGTITFRANSFTRYRGTIRSSAKIRTNLESWRARWFDGRSVDNSR
ncbi:uncharacterized protein PADG_00868 [Paracoccidioides brasiliensis Pb18]|uniref:Uncharacterized protein n=1 Tax=Paracoccidioides brasiliensis (strain Pb18) TaxID=502780 RepID=C1FYJ2_PARBD|nr:uncharacterized protein PADG_00868 [Paracoccidioides brasiliensis Pb18]EEH44579.2 hypothetical protein PADG_00868 [Paracoccidioides brasiliensis Pb18]